MRWPDSPVSARAFDIETESDQLLGLAGIALNPQKTMLE